MKFFQLLKKFVVKLIMVIVKTLHNIINLNIKCNNKNILIVVERNDDIVKEWIDEIKSRLRFYAPDVYERSISFSDRLFLISLIRGDSILICKKIVGVKLKLLKVFDNVFFVDHRCDIAGWDWVCFANYFYNHKPCIAASRANLRSAVSSVSVDASCVYVFGTGPSLARAAEQSFDDGVCIVCNTIVRDVALFNKLNPCFVVAGDAIYHFSFTEFAKSFRSDLYRRLKESATYFAYPAMFDVIVRREFSDISERLIPIPIGLHMDIDVNLVESFELPRLGNVLPLLQLPLACTLSKKIYFWGFDGRSPNDKSSPFWANSSQHSYPELMHTLKSSFPYFFEYYVPNNDSKNYIKSVHGDLLDECLTGAESRGYTFEMLHPSWTHTLAKRYRSKTSLQDTKLS